MKSEEALTKVEQVLTQAAPMGAIEKAVVAFVWLLLALFLVIQEEK